jgi:ribonucleoside-diphosphate reductase beta chain
MALLDRRLVYSPFEYPQAFKYWKDQRAANWIHESIEMKEDKDQWTEDRLTESEKQVIGRTLKGFVQSEVIIEDYWARKVSKWFPKPEIQLMTSCFASMEGEHIVSYAYLQETLGLFDFDAFLHEPAAKAKIDRLLMVKGKSKTSIAKSLAIFSAFTEGINLFSSFAILMSFSKRNLLKGVGLIVEYSYKDELLHSEAGCWLFRVFVKEYPEVLSPELIEEINQAAIDTVKLEHDFIDQSFSMGEIEGINSGDLKEYIRFRANVKLKDLGFKPIYNDINMEQVRNLDWFGVMTSGSRSPDFFAKKVADYSKGVADFSDCF